MAKKKLDIKKLNLPPQVEQLALYAQDCGWWNFKDEVDIKWFTKKFDRYGKKVPLFQKFLDLEEWVIDNTPPKGKRLNVRSLFNTFCKKHILWNSPENKIKYQKQIEKQKQKPPCSPIDFSQLIKPVEKPHTKYQPANDFRNPHNLDNHTGKPKQKINPVYTQKLTPEQLEANRKKNLEMVRKLKANGKSKN